MSDNTTLNKAYRDPNSNAVINIDEVEYQGARARKRIAQKTRDREERITSLEQRVDQLETKIDRGFEAVLKQLAQSSSST